MNGPTWQSTVIAVAFIAFLAYGLYLAVNSDFDAVWTGLGPILGVITGAIPGYFFAARAQDEQKVAQRKADALQQAAPRAVVDEARQIDPDAFG